MHTTARPTQAEACPGQQFSAMLNQTGQLAAPSFESQSCIRSELTLRHQHVRQASLLNKAAMHCLNALESCTHCVRQLSLQQMPTGYQYSQRSTAEHACAYSFSEPAPQTTKTPCVLIARGRSSLSTDNQPNKPLTTKTPCVLIARGEPSPPDKGHESKEHTHKN